MAKQYLDEEGVKYLWSKCKDRFQDTLVSGTNIKTINGTDVLGEGDIEISGGGSATIYIETTWSALKALKTAGTLVPGCIYRITDYQCTTATYDTQSAGHQYDILVVADSASSLSEDARAVLHEGDTYFANSKLSAWELKYSLDNDTTRFAWATSSGKGVVWFMKDEFNNECYYDFKNIQFKRYKATAPTMLNGYYCGIKSSSGSVQAPYGGTLTTDYIFVYTFNGGTLTSPTDGDLSLSGKSNSVYCNKIERYISGLNNIVFIGTECYSNTFGTSCYYNTFGSKCYSNTFGSGCYYNTFGSGCYSNTFGTGCYYNTFGTGCSTNTFGSGCYYNTFGTGCYYNTFGSKCYSNTFGSGCSTNTFGSGCYSNTFDTSCYYNTFGSKCYSNTFGTSCYSNTFGSGCYYNTFGTECGSNTFGSGCYSNTFGTSCYSNTFGTSCYSNTLCSTTGGYAQYSIFDNGVQYVSLEGTTSGSYSNYLQYVHLHGGIKGTKSAKKSITETRNLAYSTDYYATGYQSKTI